MIIAIPIKSLSDKRKEQRHSKAIKGAYASAKARKLKQINKLGCMLLRAYDEYKQASEIAEKNKEKGKLATNYTKDLETKKKRYIELKQQLKTANKEYKDKYKTNYLLN